MNEIKITMVDPHKRIEELPYLSLADDSEEMILQYLNEGDLYKIFYNQKQVGVALITYPSEDIVEIKNIGFIGSAQGIGLGRTTIESFIEDYRKKGYRKMIVGTANSSLGNLAFYQKVGFRMSYIKRDFFAQYEKPIFENGIRALDMIVFEFIL